ncbi:MAG TPA: 4-hydroxy-tetrahydrodipicolinate reductase [Terriglobia bacterium]|nr:4-hydroxy-tetrahydrodipicolinate reductase [Terriglobia bacterium]
MMVGTDSNPPLNLALLGYGKMGKAVAQLAPARGFEVRRILDIDSNPDGAGLTPANFEGVDVCIDFTTPDAAFENIRRVADLGCNLVVGTTGWHSRVGDVREIVDRAGIGMVYGGNFSVGAQLFFQAAEAVARVFSGFPMYEPYITEAHHRFKKDAPSGTAVELKRRTQPLLGERDVMVSSIRGGYIPGTHELGFDSEADTVILRHTARGRQGFAEGALLAARWVVGKKGLFGFSDLFGSGPP